MSNVNYLLMNAGRSPIPHGSLDFQAALKSTPDYSQVFLRAVEQEERTATAWVERSR